MEMNITNKKLLLSMKLVASIRFQTACHSEYKLVNVVPTEDQAFAQIYFLLILHFLKNYGRIMLKLWPELSP